MSEYWGDVHEMEYYVVTCKYIKMKFGKNHVLVPVIFWIDRSHKGGNQAKPVSFTLGIFTEETRRSPHAWRHLGCNPGKDGKLIPVGENKKHGDMTTWRMRDYHACLSFLKVTSRFRKNTSMVSYGVLITMDV